MEILFQNSRIICFISVFIFAIVHQQHIILDGNLSVFIFAVIEYYL